METILDFITVRYKVLVSQQLFNKNDTKEGNVENLTSQSQLGLSFSLFMTDNIFLYLKRPSFKMLMN